MKIVIDMSYEDINFIYFADDSFDPSNMKEYINEFIDIYGYETVEDHGNKYIILKNFEKTDWRNNVSYEGFYKSCEEFRTYLHRRFHFESQNFCFV